MQVITVLMGSIASVSVAGQEFSVNTESGDMVKVMMWIVIGVVLCGVAAMVLNRYLNHAMGLVSIVGLLILVGATITIPQVVKLAVNPTRTDTQAQEAIKPQAAQITNVQTTEFTVEWLTTDSVIGGVRYGSSPDNLNQAAVELNPTEKKTHHIVRITNLIPGQTYHARLISGGKEFSGPEALMSVTLPR